MTFGQHVKVFQIMWSRDFLLFFTSIAKKCPFHTKLGLALERNRQVKINHT